ncbi:hypothetical protein GJ496_009049 [Pomphorhynchus laevis]|nr:hypothetical protein GJ496_009049 [Pomphorhynchus laevis]
MQFIKRRMDAITSLRNRSDIVISKADKGPEACCGRKWHELTREEQSKYYEQARDERLKHLEMYPNWSARDNYGMRKRRRKKREKVLGDSELARKCRATYGVNQVDLWCKPCRRKKKCIRFQTSDDGCSVKSELAISTADLTSHSIEDNSEEIGIVVVDDDFVQDTNQQI